MKRLIFGAAVLAILAAGAAPATAGSGGGATKWTLCHRTASAKKPYVRTGVSTRAALRGHLARHPADIFPVPAGGCPTAALSPAAGGSVLTATMNGANEVPGPADPDGTGTAQFRMIRGAAVICFSITVHDITLPATGAHIHNGAAGVAGPIVVPLVPPGAGGTSSGCVSSTRTLVSAILDNPSGYYANVHTTDFPAGAVRGQL